MMYWHGPWCAKPHGNAFDFHQTGFDFGSIFIGRKLAIAKGHGRGSRVYFDAMAPLSSGAVYVNDLENEGEARIPAAYSDNYQRLSLIKRKFDPDNFFRVNQNIPPATERGSVTNAQMQSKVLIARSKNGVDFGEATDRKDVGLRYPEGLHFASQLCVLRKNSTNRHAARARKQYS